MHACDTNTTLAMQQRRQQDGATNYRDAAVQSGFQFGIVFRDRRRIDEQIRFSSSNPLGVVSGFDVRAASSELLNAFVHHQIGAANPAAQVQQQMPKSAHATASGADEVNASAWAEPVQEFVRLFPGE